MFTFKLYLAGDWQAVSTNSQIIQSIAKWIIDIRYPIEYIPDYIIISAERQIVAGINYKIVMKIGLQNDLWEFIVYDHFGFKSITKSTRLFSR